MLKEKRNAKVYILYILLFFLAWTLETFLVSGRLEAAFSTSVSGLSQDGICKTLIWAVPALLLIRRYNDRLFVQKELFVPRHGWPLFLAIFLVFTVYLLIIKYRQSGKIALAEDFSPLLILVYLFVGFNEEIVFRGWLLNAVYREDKMWQCFLVNSLLFLAIHFPSWIQHGSFAGNILSGGFMSIVLLSFVFSFSFVKSRNIVVPALLHFWWDLLIVCLK
ncbi:MAG: CPBP family intramembrane metalloprotease [Ruminococcus sp.]|nr:CPBP family intramembrane metalloprotease [Ruminococcus sp.]